MALNRYKLHPHCKTTIFVGQLARLLMLTVIMDMNTLLRYVYYIICMHVQCNKYAFISLKKQSSLKFTNPLCEIRQILA